MERISLDEIEAGLWLGNNSAAIDGATLIKHGITHIVTLKTVPLPTQLLCDHSFIVAKFVPLEDSVQSDLLGVLDECLDFIRIARNNQKTVLVHCVAGVSRSAAVVIAHLMQKHKIDYDEAFDMVRAKRSIQPNRGFKMQLMLFHEMMWRIDGENVVYRTYRLRLASVAIQRYISEPNEYEHLIRPDPHLQRGDDMPTCYRCRKCRRILAEDTNHLLQNHVVPGQQPNAEQPSVYDEREGPMSDVLAHSSAGAVACTQAFFVEPMEWMRDEIVHDRQGRLHCPKCRSKVGSFDWTASGSCLCPCGVLLAPAFYLVPSKVELSRPMAARK